MAIIKIKKGLTPEQRTELYEKYKDNPPPLKDAEELIHEGILVGTDFYPDDTDIPLDDCPQSWRDTIFDFGCWSGHSFKSKPENIFVDCDYFIPEAKCPQCGEICYIKKCW